MGLPGSSVFMYERVPAGVGFAEKLFTMHEQLLRAAGVLGRRCGCEAGCPSCVGPVAVVGEHGRAAAIRLAIA